ncbi:hypothetical protein SLA2020_111440 [Shorea laevis]
MLNSLPSLDNLMKKGILQETLCQNCHLANKNLMHLLLYCPHVERIWFGSTLGLNPRQLGVATFVEWWRYIKNTAKQTRMPFLVEHCAIICWHVWKVRNEKYYEHANISPQQVLARISIMLQESSCSMTKDPLIPPTRSQPTEKQGQSSWSRPPQGIYKVNVDAAFSSSSGEAALAMVGRNSKGEIYFGNIWLCSALSPLMAEALVLFKAIKVVANMGIQYAFFESDNQILISCLKQHDKPIPWEAKTLILSCRQLWKDHPEFMFSFVPREANKVADWVAKTALKGQCPLYWAHKPPNMLLFLLSMDGLAT